MTRCIVLLLWLPLLVAAAPVACASGTLDTYVALSDGCTLGDYTLSGFAFSVIDSSGVDPLPVASDFEVSAGLNPLGLLVQFTGRFAVANAETITMLFVYTIAGGSPPWAALKLDAITEVPPTPPGRFEITTEVVQPSETTSTNVFHNGGDDFVLSRTTGFTAAQQITIRSTVRLQAGGNDAGFQSFSNTVSNVPEPGAAGLAFAGLLVIAGWRLRTSRAAGN